MELSEDENRRITEVLIKASNLTDSEWLNMEKTILETYPIVKNGNDNTMVLDMWNRLHKKIEDAIDRMKKE